MHLLLASYLHPEISKYISGRVLYIDDAAAGMSQAPFAQTELTTIRNAAEELIPLTVAQAQPSDIRNEINLADCIYVASGEAFRLLDALRLTGTDHLLVEAVQNGTFYAGSSAGAMVAGPSIEPASIMDDPRTAPQLTDRTGLNLTPYVIIPHAQGTTGPYSINVISETVAQYGQDWNLLLLRDGQALLVEGGKAMLI